MCFIGVSLLPDTSPASGQDEWAAEQDFLHNSDKHCSEPLLHNHGKTYTQRNKSLRPLLQEEGACHTFHTRDVVQAFFNLSGFVEILLTYYH